MKTRQPLYVYEPPDSDRCYRCYRAERYYGIAVRDPVSGVRYPIRLTEQRDGSDVENGLATLYVRRGAAERKASWLNLITQSTNFEVHEFRPDQFTAL